MTQVTPFATTLVQNDEVAAKSELEPMPFWLSLLLFAVPALLMIGSLLIGIPLLESLGFEPIVSFLAAFTVPMAWMFTAALVTYHKVEGRPLRSAPVNGIGRCAASG